MYVSGFYLYVIDHDRRYRYICPILQANLPLSGDHIIVSNTHGREFIPNASEHAIFHIRQIDTDSFDFELYHQHRMRAVHELAEMTVRVNEMLKTQHELCDWSWRVGDYLKYKRLKSQIPKIMSLITYQPLEI